MVAAVAALLLLGCGCGGSASTTEETTTEETHAKVVEARLEQPTICFLTVFLSESVTPAQKSHVEELLLANPRIREIAFVPKALALRRLAEKQPDVAKGMHVNPFPDQFEIVPGTRSDLFAIVTDFAAGVDGVTNVRPSSTCAQTS